MGNWVVPFDKELTHERSFHVTQNHQVKVSMMTLRDEEYYVATRSHVRYLESDAFKAVELPYKGGALSMVVFLPGKVEGLADFEKGLTAARLYGWLSRLRPQTADVYLPRFKMTAELSLRQTLSAMGMPLAFNGRGDFSAMTRRKDQEFIESVVHKAFVEVNELGTEAAAATGVGFAGSIRKTFLADHPFVFLIRDTRSGSILFLGRVVEPGKE
jgi:serpin B